MFSYISNQYHELSKADKKNIQLWIEYYQNTHHIALFKARKLAQRKTNIKFNK